MTTRACPDCGQPVCPDCGRYHPGQVGAARSSVLPFHNAQYYQPAPSPLTWDDLCMAPSAPGVGTPMYKMMENILTNFGFGLVTADFRAVLIQRWPGGPSQWLSEGNQAGWAAPQPTGALPIGDARAIICGMTLNSAMAAWTAKQMGAGYMSGSASAPCLRRGQRHGQVGAAKSNVLPFLKTQNYQPALTWDDLCVSAIAPGVGVPMYKAMQNMLAKFGFGLVTANFRSALIQRWPGGPSQWLTQGNQAGWGVPHPPGWLPLGNARSAICGTNSNATIAAWTAKQIGAVQIGTTSGPCDQCGQRHGQLGAQAATAAQGRMTSRAPAATTHWQVPNIVNSWDAPYPADPSHTVMQVFIGRLEGTVKVVYTSHDSYMALVNNIKSHFPDPNKILSPYLYLISSTPEGATHFHVTPGEPFPDQSDTDFWLWVGVQLGYVALPFSNLPVPQNVKDLNEIASEIAQKAGPLGVKDPYYLNPSAALAWINVMGWTNFGDILKARSRSQNIDWGASWNSCATVDQDMQKYGYASDTSTKACYDWVWDQTITWAAGWYVTDANNGRAPH